MRQAGSDFKRHLNAIAAFPTAEPSLAGDGVDAESDSTALMRVAKVLVKVQVTGAGAVKVAIKGRDRVGDWGIVGENGGLLNLGADIPGGTGATAVRYFYLRDVGAFNRFAAVATLSSGTPTVSVWFAAVMERGD